MCEERFAGEMISTVGGRLPGGMARVEVVVVGRVVVVEEVDVVVVVGTVVVVVVLDVVPSSGAVVVVVAFDPAAAVAAGSSTVESASSAAGEHAARRSSATRPSAANCPRRPRVRDTPTELQRAFRRLDRRMLRSCSVRVTMRSAVSSIP